MGEWKDDKKHGFGRQFNFLGDFYEGMWWNGEKRGEGVRRKINGSTIKEYWMKGR